MGSLLVASPRKEVEGLHFALNTANFRNRVSRERRQEQGFMFYLFIFHGKKVCALLSVHLGFLVSSALSPDLVLKPCP